MIAMDLIRIESTGGDMIGYDVKGFQRSWLHKNGTMYDENWCDAQGQWRKDSYDKCLRS